MISKLKSLGMTAVGMAVFFVVSSWFESDGIRLSGIEHYVEQVSTEEAKQLGFMLFHDKQYAQARAYFELAAKAGDVPSQITLATLYYYDENNTENFKLAYYWFIKNADNPLAQYYISIMYHLGDYLEKDPEKSRHWMQKAAYQSLPVAQHNLAVGYFNQGQYLEAYVWASYAKVNDFSRAKKLAKDARNNMTPQEKALAQQTFMNTKADHIWQSGSDNPLSSLFMKVL